MSYLMKTIMTWDMGTSRYTPTNLVSKHGPKLHGHPERFDYRSPSHCSLQFLSSEIGLFLSFATVASTNPLHICKPIKWHTQILNYFTLVFIFHM